MSAFIRKYYYFFCVTVLVLSRSLTTSSIVNALTWYLASNGVDVMNSAILTNLQDSLSSIFVLFMSLAADSSFRRFRTLMLSNIAYDLALVLFLMFHSHNLKWTLVIPIILTSLGTSGGKILRDALVDLVHDIDTSHNQNITRSIARATIWFLGACVSGALIAILWVAPGAFGGVHQSWESSFLICLITMTLALIIFGVSHIVYHHRELTVEILRCIRRFSRQVSSTNLDLELGENKRIAPAISALHLDTDDQHKEDNMNACFKQEGGIMLVLKSVSKMFPMWGVFFVVSIISASGSAFFSLQYSNLNTDNDIAVQIYSLVKLFSKFAIAFLYPKNEKIKIGMGLICGVLSCVFAWQLEVYRLKEVSNLVDEDTNTSISFLWLVPQFCLLGLMEGLTEKGLLQFCKSQIREEEEHLRRYREEYIAFFMGIGKLLNIFLILMFKGWFGETVNYSRLDKYYLVLVCAGSANFIIYCCIARFCYMDQELANNNAQKDHLMEEQIRGIEQKQDLAGDEEKQDNYQDEFANHDLKQDHLMEEQIRGIKQKQDLAGDEEKQDNYQDEFANHDLKQDHLMEEQIRGIEQKQDFVDVDHLNKTQKQDEKAVVNLKSG